MKKFLSEIGKSENDTPYKTLREDILAESRQKLQKLQSKTKRKKSRKIRTATNKANMKITKENHTQGTIKAKTNKDNCQHVHTRGVIISYTIRQTSRQPGKHHSKPRRPGTIKIFVMSKKVYYTNVYKIAKFPIQTR